MGRNKKPGKRVGNRLSRAIKDIVARGLVPPADYILARRRLFALFAAERAPEFVIGSDGALIHVDNSHDGIGQLWLVGLLDGHGVDPQEMRDKGRVYAELYWKRYSATAPKMGTFERADKSTSSYDGETAADRLFERMDEALGGYERACVVDLVIDPMWGDEVTPWAHSLICEVLLQRKIAPPAMTFPTLDDRGRLRAAIRGLCSIVDGALPQRWEKRAA